MKFLKLISLLSVLSFIFLLSICACWDLSSYGVNNKNYYISSVAVYRTRAFLALPRSMCYNAFSGPTLVETNWIEELLHTPIIKGGRHQILNYQKWGECEHIQDAVSLDIEHKVHKLWILDRGNELCLPKIASFSLFYNSISEVSQLTNIIGGKLNILTIDPVVGKSGQRAYVGNAGENSLLVFSLEKLVWWRLELLEQANPLSSINADFLAISKTGPELFIASENDLELFALDLHNLRTLEEPSIIDEKNTRKENVTLIGKKLGKSRGLEADFKSGLSYFMMRDYAIVRWLIGSPIEAEYHNVLAQSYEKFPFVSELFTGPQNGLWAIVNPAGQDGCSNFNETMENLPELQSRVVRILRYNKFVRDLEVDRK
ncbi:uncharacterized protein [Leptinotarsa decemlineata]|uniref:uncharacterized protein n=1 Tax=Leptinotarsa decemlineata TaxID=7539 RepID=UPI003D305C8E